MEVPRDAKRRLLIGWTACALIGWWHACACPLQCGRFHVCASAVTSLCLATNTVTSLSSRPRRGLTSHCRCVTSQPCPRIAFRHGQWRSDVTLTTAVNGLETRLAVSSCGGATNLWRFVSRRCSPEVPSLILTTTSVRPDRERAMLRHVTPWCRCPSDDLQWRVTFNVYARHKHPATSKSMYYCRQNVRVCSYMEQCHRLTRRYRGALFTEREELLCQCPEGTYCDANGERTGVSWCQPNSVAPCASGSGNKTRHSKTRQFSRLLRGKSRHINDVTD